MTAARILCGVHSLLELRAPLILTFLVVLPAASPAQLVLGQYEDEAPLRSWNNFGLPAAASLGRGETQLAFSDDCSAALANPALLPSLPGFSALLSGSYSYTSFYRYSIVNTGVLTTENNPAVSRPAIDLAGLSFGCQGWEIALTAALIESYDRPDVSARSYFEGLPYYDISFAQTGHLRDFNLALARAFGPYLQAGIGFNLVRGELHRQVIDRDLGEDITIHHLIDQEFSGFFINAGVLAHMTDRLDLACIIRTPYDKKAECQSRLRYQAPLGGTDILIEAASDDRYRQPWAAGLGVHYGVSEHFRIMADLVYFLWSQYRAEYFGEDERRDFRNTFKTAAGGEYRLPIRLFGQDASLPLRLGVSYDRQPMRDPGSAYTNLSFGAGVRWRMVVLDIGGLFGWESGSGHSLRILRIASSLGVRI